MWGAEQRTAKVVMIVNAVKTIRQNLSITIAANFQSPIISASSSCIFIRLVINFSSFKIHWSSRVVAEVACVGVAGIQLCAIGAVGGNELGTYVLFAGFIYGDEGGSWVLTWSPMVVCSMGFPFTLMNPDVPYTAPTDIGL